MHIGDFKGMKVEKIMQSKPYMQTVDMQNVQTYKKYYCSLKQFRGKNKQKICNSKFIYDIQVIQT